MAEFDGHTGPLVQHCCDEMDRAINHWRDCPDHDSPFDCPDALIYFSYICHKKYDKGYGIINHDGGSSMSTIRFCPFCGTELKKTGREVRKEILDDASDGKDR
jgi:hypothetical protein